MGTHPIFESDFDCLTDMSDKPSSVICEDAVLDQVVWYRWFISLLVGPIWGLLGLTGLFAIALYGLGIASFSLYLVNRHGPTALESVGGTSLVLKEGGLASFAAFCVTWIITFSLVNG